MRSVPATKGDPATLLKRFLKPGMTAVDVGAAVGHITELMAKCVGPTGTVVAIEADPRKASALGGVKANYPWVDVLITGAGEATGTFTLHRAGSTQGSRWHGAGDSVTADMRTLDDLLEPYPHIDVVKMDIQGSEAHALDGATKLLQRCPMWVIELWPWGLWTAGRSGRDVIEAFRAAGLRPRWADGSVIDDYAIDAFDGHRGTERHSPMRNIVIEPPDQRNWWNISAGR